MLQVATMNRDSFDMSFGAFQAQAKAIGQDFWRGVTLGFTSAMVLFQLAGAF
jgi:hypothetical protein